MDFVPGAKAFNFSRKHVFPNFERDALVNFMWILHSKLHVSWPKHTSSLLMIVYLPLQPPYFYSVKMFREETQLDAKRNLLLV